MPSIVKVLFACKKYPDLNDNQMFVILAFKFRDDEIDIIGQVIEFIKKGY